MFDRIKQFFKKEPEPEIQLELPEQSIPSEQPKQRGYMNSKINHHIFSSMEELNTWVETAVETSQFCSIINIQFVPIGVGGHEEFHLFIIHD